MTLALVLIIANIALTLFVIARQYDYWEDLQNFLDDRDKKIIKNLQTNAIRTDHRPPRNGQINVHRKNDFMGFEPSALGQEET